MISYIGGKNRMSNWINGFIPKDITTYVEGFSGMYWVFFNMDLEDYPNLKTVVYNDYNQLNANLFKCAKQYDRLWDELNKYPCQQLGVADTPPEYEQLFNKCQKEVFDPNLVIGDEPDFDIAGKYVYVLTQVFSGSKPETSKYVDYKGKYRCKVLIFMDKLKHPKYREHFDKITFVENMDFQEVIEKYDSPGTYFYCDPPYYSTEKYYSNHDFGRADHERLMNTLKKIQGKFSLSYYEFPELNEWFPKDKYPWAKKSFKKAAGSKKDGTQNDGIELLIMNYGDIIPEIDEPIKDKVIIENNTTVDIIDINIHHIYKYNDDGWGNPIGNENIAIAELKNGKVIMIDREQNPCINDIDPSTFSIEIGGDIARQAYLNTIQILKK